MSAQIIFFLGLGVLALFAWYFSTDILRRKRTIGTVLALLVAFICLEALWPKREGQALNLNLGLDLQGGSEYLIQLQHEERQLDSEADEAISGFERDVRQKDALEQAVEVIRGRIDGFGVAEPIIVPTGSDRILVQMPGLDEEQIEAVKEQLQKVARLEFRLVHPQSSSLIEQFEAGVTNLPPGYRIIEYKETRQGRLITEQLLLKIRPDMEGERVARARALYGQDGWEISLTFDGEGSREFADLTRANVGNRLAIVLDGEVMSAPNIISAITGGRAQITGRFSETEVRNLASVLENPLATPVEIMEERRVSATLGADSVNSGIVAGLIGLALTLFSVAIYYRMAGLVANLALLLNIVLLLGLLAMFGATLTLPGIAGIILTIGMAIDANVLIYERLREELNHGKSLKTAVDSAYDKAFSAIFDSNITTLMTALVLFWQAVGAVRGFAVTLSLGILASLFTALLVTRTTFRWIVDTGLIKRLPMFDIMPKKVFNFIGHARVALSISGLAILAAAVLVYVRADDALGVDFTGGDLLTLQAPDDLSVEEIRSAVSASGFETVIQRSATADNEYFSIRSGYGTGEEVMAALQSSFPGRELQQEGVQLVGPVIGDEMAKKSLIALAIGMVVIMLYVAFRFEFSFAIGAIVAVVHDIIITIGIFVLFGRELSLIFVGAILTIAGYSINDTIVVFDRIRERLLEVKRQPVAQIMNEAINATLGRTILTGGTTLLAVAALYIFGGPVLNDFALAILIGVVVGTYSSIFVAAPVVLWWTKARGSSIRKEVLESERGAAPNGEAKPGTVG